jgi:hypothetical protein
VEAVPQLKLVVIRITTQFVYLKRQSYLALPFSFLMQYIT